MNTEQEYFDEDAQLNYDEDDKTYIPPLLDDKSIDISKIEINYNSKTKGNKSEKTKRKYYIRGGEENFIHFRTYPFQIFGGIYDSKGKYSSNLFKRVKSGFNISFSERSTDLGYTKLRTFMDNIADKLLPTGEFCQKVFPNWAKFARCNDINNEWKDPRNSVIKFNLVKPSKDGNSKYIQNRFDFAIKWEKYENIDKRYSEDMKSYRDGMLSKPELNEILYPTVQTSFSKVKNIEELHESFGDEDLFGDGSNIDNIDESDQKLIEKEEKLSENFIANVSAPYLKNMEKYIQIGSCKKLTVILTCIFKGVSMSIYEKTLHVAPIIDITGMYFQEQKRKRQGLSRNFLSRSKARRNKRNAASKKEKVNNKESKNDTSCQKKEILEQKVETKPKVVEKKPKAVEKKPKVVEKKEVISSKKKTTTKPKKVKKKVAQQEPSEDESDSEGETSDETIDDNSEGESASDTE